MQRALRTQRLLPFVHEADERHEKKRRGLTQRRKDAKNQSRRRSGFLRVFAPLRETFSSWWLGCGSRQRQDLCALCVSNNRMVGRTTRVLAGSPSGAFFCHQFFRPFFVSGCFISGCGGLAALGFYGPSIFVRPGCPFFGRRAGAAGYNQGRLSNMSLAR